MHRRALLLLSAIAASGFGAPQCQAMGYDSLACPELAERRIAYFTDNAFCAPGIAEGTPGLAGRPCKTPDGPSSLPLSDRTQVEMIIKVEARKSCPAK